MCLKINSIQRKWLYILFVFLAVVLLVVISWGHLTWNEDVTDVLPYSPELADYKEIIRIFRPNDKVFILVKMPENDIPERELLQTADELAARLKKATQNGVLLFSNVLYYQDVNPFESINFFLKHQGAYFDEDIRYISSQRLNKEWLIERLEAVKKELLNSPAPGLIKMVSKDPLNLSGKCFESLQGLLSNQGNIRMHRGRLFSENLRSVIIIAEPIYKNTNIEQARHLVNRVEQVLEDVLEKHERIEVSWLSGHRFSVDNSKIIRNDVKRVFIISVVLIIILIWISFRRLLNILLLVLPSVFGFMLSFSVVVWIYGSVSIIALGMAVILAGITIDYSIHVLCHSFVLGSKKKSLINLRRPLSLAAATTAIAFASLQFSRIAVVKQLSTIATFCVIGSAMFALFGLPLLLSKPGVIKQRSDSFDIGRFAHNLFKLSHNKRIILILFLSLLFLFGLSMLRIEDDILKYNALSKNSKHDFDEIRKIISTGEKIVSIAVQGDDLEEALGYNNNLFSLLETMRMENKIKGITSIARVLPSPIYQADNLFRWKDYWNPERRNLLAVVLKKTAMEIGMTYSVFKPYLVRMETDEIQVSINNLPPSLRALVDEHIKKYRGKTYILTRIEPTEECDIADISAQLRASLPSVFIADMGLMKRSTMDLIVDEFIRIGGLMLLLIGIFLILILRNLRCVLELLLPLVLAILWTFGALGLLGLKVNVSSSIIIVVIFGLVIDYSIFITEAARIQKKIYTSAVALAMTLSGLSTIAAFGSLIFAKHPILHTCGVTALVSTIFGWLAVSLGASLFKKEPQANKELL